MLYFCMLEGTVQMQTEFIIIRHFLKELVAIMHITTNYNTNEISVLVLIKLQPDMFSF